MLSRFGHGRPGFEQARQWFIKLVGRHIHPRPFQMRFKSAESVELMAKAFEQAVAPWRDPRPRRPSHPLAKHFEDIIAVDCTRVQLADDLRPWLPGSRAMKAALKVALGISLFGLLPVFGQVLPGTASDMVLFPHLALFKKGTLLLFDNGFSKHDRLKEIIDAGHYFLCPMMIHAAPIVVGCTKAPAKVRKAVKRSPQGVHFKTLLPSGKTVRKAWDLDVLIRASGDTHYKRPIAIRVVILPGRHRRPFCYYTNLARDVWTPDLVRELYRLRWQIELTIKELKSHLNLRSVPSKDRHAVQVFVWASMLALVVSRAVGTWIQPKLSKPGLASRTRPALISQALRECVQSLGAMLAARVNRNTQAALLSWHLRSRLRERQTQREDSFKRIKDKMEESSSP